MSNIQNWLKQQILTSKGKNNVHKLPGAIVIGVMVLFLIVGCANSTDTNIKCTACGATIAENANFCSSCGSSIEGSSNSDLNNNANASCAHRWSDANCTNPKTCSKCGETSGNPLGHLWEPATCTKPETCSDCGETSGDALGHSWEPASCTQPKTCSILSLQISILRTSISVAFKECPKINNLWARCESRFFSKDVYFCLNAAQSSRILSIQPHFENPDEARAFVLANMERMKRNMIVRRMRLARKINMGTWNYFCSFTYDDQKHTEESFRKGLSNCFKKLCHRKEWVYIGVWERAPETGRLHFHGIFYIPEGGMVGALEEHRDYSFATRSRKVTLQNTYFNRRFGRSDFSPIDCRQQLGSAMAYLMKYIAKSQERIVYSRGTHAYFISDILDNDVACTMGEDDTRLFD